MKLHEMFPDRDSRISEVDGEIQEAAPFSIRSEDGATFIIDRLYWEAIRFGVGTLADKDGNLPLVILAERDEPRFSVPAPARDEGPKAVFAIGRIIWDAGSYGQVERRSKAGLKARDWTISNTLIGHGKRDNADTRAAFLAFVVSVAGQAAADETTHLLRRADGILRPTPDQITKQNP